MTGSNLLLVHTPVHQDIADFLTIRNMMIGKAPDIDVSVISAGNMVPLDFLNSALPKLIFSPMPIVLPPTIEARLLCPPQKTTKFQEYKLLRDAHLPVPESYFVQTVEELESIELDDVVVIKPNIGRRGNGVQLIELSSLKKWSREDFRRSPSNRGGMIVQKYINIGETPESYRVLTVLGDAVYCAKYISNVNLSSVSQEQLTSGVSVAANVDDRRMELADDPDIVELAKRVHQALNCTPVMGVDVAREKDTGRLYVLELNSAGMTWHLSSDRGKGAQRKFSLNLYDQFNALKVITDRLILQTRLMAN